ncbi:MAG: redoxin domain-containing protein [Deltaproteobacteria bacterium]|nr:redoxin domain-containing protein [Deltaproteobacteria bacterium]
MLGAQSLVMLSATCLLMLSCAGAPSQPESDKPTKNQQSPLINTEAETSTVPDESVTKDDPRGRCPKNTEAMEPWIASEKLSKELLASRSDDGKIVFVKYKDCNLEILGDCGVGGGYSYKQTERTKIGEYIYNPSDLHNYLPFDATSLEQKFDAGGLWSFQAVRVGDYIASISNVGRDQLRGKCEDATHFIKKMLLGAYRIESKKQEGDTEKKEVIRRGGSFERCLLSEMDSKSPVCQTVVRVSLKPIAHKSALPTSAPHQLLKQPPGPERSRRLEIQHTGEWMHMPVDGKVTVLAFWSTLCDVCDIQEEENETKIRAKKKRKRRHKKKKSKEEECESCEDPSYDLSKQIMAGLDGIWRKVDQKQVEIVGVAVDVDIFRARSRLDELSVTFPMVIDAETGKLKNRYHIGEGRAVIFVIDKKGIVRFFAESSSSPSQALKKVHAAIQALTD